MENLRHGDEHKRRTCLQVLACLCSGEGEYSRDDHKTGKDCDCSIEYFDLIGRLFNGDFLLHIRTEGDQNTHCDRQGIEHLPHRRNYCHPGEVCEVRNQHILHTCHCTRAGHGIDGNDKGEHNQYRHHDAGY